MAKKSYYAYHDMDCEKCGDTICKDEEFFWFEGDKICEECWAKLVNFYEDEL